ncbi:hypothetical protein HHK36_013108 [Tetracentron sinense]|uniref:BED-type domain-containing protein n=1 Tax=Tetracentron sinense TaxID=13715 RepID=A0A834ZE27_TETSI|nr:hypothetical protein HHK36_013108 [Tetracentron sinense]
MVRDIGWSHGKQIEGNKNGAICNYCGKKIRSGGITRLKWHLAGGDSNVADCPSCPMEVRQAMKVNLTIGAKQRLEHVAEQKAIRQEIRRGLQPPVDVDDDDEDDTLYPIDCIGVDERLAYRQGYRQSMRQQWDKDQKRSFAARMRSADFRGSVGAGPSGSTGRTSDFGTGTQPHGMFGRSQSMKVPDLLHDSSLYKSRNAKQKWLKEMWSGGSLVEALGTAVSKFFIHSHVPANAASTPQFKNMIHEAERVGPGVEPPPYEITEYGQRRTILANKVEDIVLNNKFWDKVDDTAAILEPIYRVLRVIDADKWPTMGSVYELMRVMKLSIKNVSPRGYKWVHKIIDARWDKTMEHPLHAAAYYLNPKYHYNHKLGNRDDLIKAVHDVFETLDPKLRFRDARGSFGRTAAKEGRSRMMPYNPLFEWVKVSSLDENDGRPNAVIASAAIEMDIDVERVIATEVGSSTSGSRSSFSTESFDEMIRSLKGPETSSARTAGTSILSNSNSEGGDEFDDHDESDGGGDNPGDGGNIGVEPEQRPLSPFTAEADFDHAT